MGKVSASWFISLVFTLLTLPWSVVAAFQCDAPLVPTECVKSSWHGWKQDRQLFQDVCNGNLVRWGDDSSVQDCGEPCFACSFIRACCDTNYPFSQFSATYTAEGGYTSRIKALKAQQGNSDRCYIYTLGTSQDILLETYSQYFLEEMASNGFCAATVEYPENSLIEYIHADIEWKSRSIYNPNSVDSAVRRLEVASEGACKCDHVVAHGFSQGAHIAAMSANFNPNVEGILLFSGQCQANLIDRCDLLSKENTRIPKHKIRNIASQRDGVLGCGFADSGRTSLHQTKLVTGANCDGSTCTSSSCKVDQCKDDCSCSNFINNCLENDGGGYYLLKEVEYQRGHNWFLEAGRIWETAKVTSEPFNIPSNLAWLRSRAAPALPDPNRAYKEEHATAFAEIIALSEIVL